MGNDTIGQAGTLYWLTGLAGAGKTTIGREVMAALRAEKPNVVHFDGDQLREIFDAGEAYTPEDRLRLAHHYMRLCKLVSDQGCDVVCTTISMFPDVQAWGRKNVQRYFEVYVRASIETLKLRDQKALYSRAERGECQNVMGMDIPIVEPILPNLCLDNEGDRAPKDLAAHILDAAKDHFSNRAES